MPGIGYQGCGATAMVEDGVIVSFSALYALYALEGLTCLTTVAKKVFPVAEDQQKCNFLCNFVSRCNPKYGCKRA